MLNKYSVKQNGYKDCASACVLSIMKYYNFNMSQEELSLIIKTDSNGTNAYNLLEGIKLLGFDGYAKHYTYEDIINNIISFPIICHTLYNNFYHFIVIYKNDNKNNILYVMDPAYGIKKIKYDEFKKVYLNTSIKIYPVKKIKDLTNNNKNLLNQIAEYIKYEKKDTFKVLALSIIVTILGILINFYSKIIIDNFLIQKKLKIIIIISIVFIINALLKNILDYIKNKYIINIDNNVSKKINEKVIKHLFNLPYDFFKNKPPGEVISRLEDLKNIKRIFSNIIVNAFINIILIIISMIILLLINRKLFTIVFISMIFYFIITILYKNIFDSKTLEVQESESAYNKKLIDSIMSYESIKNINILEENLLQIEKTYFLQILKTKKYDEVLIKEKFIKDTLSNIFFIFSIFYSFILIMKKDITIGTFILFNSISYYFTEPLKDMMNLIPSLSYIKNSYKRINDILLMKEKENYKTNETIKGNIKIDSLSYTHDNINLLLSKVKLEINYGSKYLIYGKSGSGKSTLMKILLKYLNEYKGTILINDKNLKDIDDAIISNSFTYVSQDNYICSETLKNNILYGRNIDDNKYEEILKICNVDKIRDSKEMRNNFLIEDNGFNISGGEKQKILLARSLLKESNYIILDEALSEVGSKEEKEIINKIFNKFKDKTIIYITHKKEIISLFKNKYYLERSKGKC